MGEAAPPRVPSSPDRPRELIFASHARNVTRMRILAFAASVRKGSLNHKLVSLAADLARRAGAEIDLAVYGDFEMPMYDADADRERGLPRGALELKKRVERAQALLIASPEYNYSIAGTLKNAIDWVSRARPMPWKGKSVYLLSASPSPMGGIRGLWQTRIPLEGCGAIVFPEMFAVPHADDAFDEDGRLKDPGLMQRLDQEMVGFVRLAEAVCEVNGQCLGEHREIGPALEDESELQPEAH